MFSVAQFPGSFSNFCANGLVVEAVSVLNGDHIGLNSRLASLVRNQRKHMSASNASDQMKSYRSVFNELDIGSIDFSSLLKRERSCVLSHDCHVTDVIRSARNKVKMHGNPYWLMGGKRDYSTFVKARHHLLSSSFIKRHFPSSLDGTINIRHLSDFHILQLESRANSETDNPRAQYEYLQAVYQKDPKYVVRRFESGRYAVNEQVRSIYQKALLLVQGTSYTRDDSVSNRGKALGSIFDFSNNSSSYSDATSTSNGNKENPLHVVVQPRRGGVLREIWYLARFIIIAFMITSFVSSALFTQMKGGAQPMTKDFRPDSSDKHYTFDDVQGIDEAKAELQEVVKFLKNPSQFKRLGAKLPTGMLLIGPPGTGKTLLAKAIAGEAEVPFFFASGSEFDEMFVGIGAARVRKLFEQARHNKPCVVFIDELDAVGGARIASAIHPYSRMTLNQLLVELDGYKELEGVVVIGATNFPESLDKALIRPGRFDTHVHIPMPDAKARYHILKLHSKKIKLAQDVDLERVARGTTGFSGADLANLINQSALKASGDGKNHVTLSDIEFAKDKIIMGPEKKSAVIDEETKRTVAYHEGGHAIVALYTQDAIPIHKATIMPRGPALGMVSLHAI
jgi:ATP-dependent metalloprotease